MVARSPSKSPPRTSLTRSAPAPIRASSSTRRRPSSASRRRPRAGRLGREPADDHRNIAMTSAAESFMFDRAAETMPRADLAALQLKRLRETVERAYAKVSHVRAKLDAAAVAPSH